MSSKQKHTNFVVVPRIVRLEYRELTHGEKWLYVCLRDLCGEDGTCFRALRTLEEETGIAFGSLGPMIKHLHKVGLIHAEKKRRPGGTRDLWHITITDIWAKNAAYITKHKKESVEQQDQGDYIEEYTEQMEALSNVQNSHNDSGNVQFSHIDVQNSHSTPAQCSEFTRECVKNLTEREVITKTSLITNTECEKESTPILIAEIISSTLSLDQQIWFDSVYCQSKIGRIVPDVIDEILKKHIIKIMQHAKSVEELNSLYDYVQRKITEGGLRDQTVYPGNLANKRNLAGWLQEQERSVTTYYGDDQDSPQTSAASGVQRSTRRARKRQEGFITEGPLAGQPDYDADPWS